MEDDKRSPYDEPLDMPGEESTPAKPQKFNTPKKSRNFKKPLLIFAGIIVLALLAYGGYKLLSKKKPANQTSSNTSQSTASNAPKTSDVPSAPTKQYTAESLAVSFDYPSNWTVSETEGAPTIKSPVFTYTTKLGVQKGYFKVYIRSGARDVDSKYIGRGVVVQPTEKLTYTKPAPSQRKDTNLSYFGYDDSTNFAYFMITGNFDSLKKGDSLGPNYGKEPGTYIIVGGYAADENKDDLSFTQVPPDGFQNTNAYKQAVDIIKSLQVS